MKKILNSKWTSTTKVYGWRHYQVRNFLKKQKKIELFSVCDKSVYFIINIDELKDRGKWIPGWIDII
tara:strand:- start:669 stop:869 length:201 start_codon:yes stop_codon:yes gene_type:complete